MATLFNDVFIVGGIDWDSEANEKVKKFDQVSRVEAKSEFYDYSIVVDVNTNIYPIKEGEKIEVLISDSLYEVKDTNETGYTANKKLSATAESFDYIMHGRVYKYTQKKSKAEVYASYGGLLMQLRGEATILSKDRFAVDSKVYLFIRKG